MFVSIVIAGIEVVSFNVRISSLGFKPKHGISARYLDRPRANNDRPHLESHQLIIYRSEGMNLPSSDPRHVVWATR